MYFHSTAIILFAVQIYCYLFDIQNVSREAFCMLLI